MQESRIEAGLALALAGLHLLVACPGQLRDRAEDASMDAAGPEPEAPPWTELVRVIGRHERVAPGHVRYGWPGTGISVRFHGTGLWLRMDDLAGYHGVTVDGQDEEPLRTTPGEQRVRVVDGLPPGEHTVVVRRRTEGHLGPTDVLDVDVAGTLLPAPAPAARMEVIGDSITAGYGNEGSSHECRFSPRTQNHLRSYAALAADAVGAELSAIAWSGKGVVHNYGGDPVEPLPAIYERSVPTEPGSRWLDPEPADVVLVNLGTNDFSTDADPSAERFVLAYVELLARVRARHPGAPILCTVAPLLSRAEAAVVEATIDQAIALRRAAGDGWIRRIDLHEEPRGWGCDWHPSVATHEAMAARLQPWLEDALQ